MTRFCLLYAFVPNFFFFCVKIKSQTVCHGQREHDRTSSNVQSETWERWWICDLTEAEISECGETICSYYYSRFMLCLQNVFVLYCIETVGRCSLFCSNFRSHPVLCLFVYNMTIRRQLSICLWIEHSCILVWAISLKCIFFSGESKFKKRKKRLPVWPWWCWRVSCAAAKRPVSFHLQTRA